MTDQELLQNLDKEAWWYVQSYENWYIFWTKASVAYRLSWRMAQGLSGVGLYSWTGKAWVFERSFKPGEAAPVVVDY